MYTLIDLVHIKRDSDNLVFTNRDSEYQNFVNWYHDTTPAVPLENTDVYETFTGKLKDKNCIFVKMKASGTAKRVATLSANKNRKRGQLINALCKTVVEYITGKNDSANLTGAEIDSFLAAHGSILTPLSQNRHNTAKGLIDSATIDQFVTQEDKENIQAIYDVYLPRIAEVV